MDVTPSKYPPLPNRRSLTPRKSHFTSSTPSKYSPGNGDGMMRSSYGGDIDYHLLDYKQPYEFLNKYYVPGEERALLEQITYQLKLSRNLLQISTIIMNTDINSDIIQQIIDCSQVLLDAEKVIFASMDKNGDLLINGSDGLVTINSGIECKFISFFFLIFS